MVGSNTVVPVIADRIATQRSLRYSKSHESGHGNVADSTYTHALAHDALTVPEDNSKEIRGARGGAWCSCLKRRHVSLFWPEKLWLFVCYGQVFGLWWTIARAWPLPAYFRDATRWTTWLNGDAPSALSWQLDAEVRELRGSTFGVLDGYWMIAAAWAALPAVVALAYYLLLSYGRSRYWDMRNVHMWGWDLLTLLAVLLQLPALLSLSRLYVCQHDPHYEGYRLSVDPELECYSPMHLIVAGCCLPSTLFFALLLPLGLMVHIKRRLVYNRRNEHERFLRWKETEFVHDLSFDWRRDQYWLFSSFVRTGGHPYDRPLWMLCMTVLVVVFCYGRPMPSVQADIFFGVLVLWSLRHAVSPGYRCGTTNAMALVLYAGLSVMCFWGVMRAHHLTNSLTVDSIWNRAVTLINITLLATLSALMLLSLYPRFGWPLGHIGPHLWKKLMAEELNSTAAAANAVPQTARAGTANSGVGGALTSRWQSPRLPRARSLRGAISARDLRQHQMDSMTDNFVSMFTARGTAGGGESGTARVHEEPRFSSPFAQHTPPLAAVGGSGVGSGVGSGGGGDTAVNVDVEALEQQQQALVLSEQPHLGVTVMYPTPRGRPSVVGSALEPGDLESMLAARERQYELQEVYGEAGAEQLLLAEHTRNFKWSAGGAVAGGLPHDAYEEGDEESGGLGGHAARTGAESQSLLPSGAAGVNSARLRHVVAARSGGGRALNRPNANVMPLGGLPDDDDDGHSVGSIPLELRQLTAAEVSALEAVWVTLVKQSRVTLRAYEALPPELVNVPELRRRALQLKREYRRAFICRHVLAWTLEETLDDLGSLADACHSRTLFPNAELEQLMRHLKQRMDQRDIDFALTRTKRKRAALKLLALACWMNGRKISRLRIRGVNDALFAAQDAADPALRNDEFVKYAHITSVFRDVSTIEISMMGVADLAEVTNEALAQRVAADLSHAIPTPSPGASDHAPSTAITDIDNLDQLAALPAVTLHAETEEMLCACFDRADELLSTKAYAGEGDPEVAALLHSTLGRLHRWLYYLMPQAAESRGINAPLEMMPFTPALTSRSVHTAAFELRPQSRNAASFPSSRATPQAPFHSGRGLAGTAAQSGGVGSTSNLSARSSIALGPGGTQSSSTGRTAGSGGGNGAPPDSPDFTTPRTYDSTATGPGRDGLNSTLTFYKSPSASLSVSRQLTGRSDHRVAHLRAVAESSDDEGKHDGSEADSKDDGSNDESKYDEDGKDD